MKFDLFIIFAFISTLLNASNRYEKDDSIRIENILKKAYTHGTDNIIIDIAKEFIETPYIGGVLDRGHKEEPVVNTRELDCTTFVEIVTAIILTHKQNSHDFHSFCRNLERLRYRNGECNGYASRLHYTSQWIEDEAKQGIVEEVAGKAHTATQMIKINFMSRHPEKYPRLINNPKLVKEVEFFENAFNNKEIKYIPKAKLQMGKEHLNIDNGDILALVTNIAGLDVSHMGFAFWENGVLHLLHASSLQGKVIADETPLYEYQKTKKNHLGIRVFRIIQ